MVFDLVHKHGFTAAIFTVSDIYAAAIEYQRALLAGWN
jgi:hypothetical protein